MNRRSERQPCLPAYSHDADRKTLLDKITQVYVKHPQTLECLTDWVKVINTRLEDYEKLPEGKVQIMELLRENQHNLIDIFFFIKCDKCRKGTKVQADQKKGSKCDHCSANLKTDETNFFVILPVEQQIVQSVHMNWSAINKHWTEINERETNEASDTKSYTDAQDGEILRNILAEYKDSEVNILSLCLNVDGANKFKSNNYSVWPIQLIQDYLPPYMRFIPQNIILNGLYYQKSGEGAELDFHSYLQPLIDELNALARNPISLEIEGVHYKFKPIVVRCAMDLPAKSKVQETKQFGGCNACTYCHIPGKRVLIENLKTTKKSSKTKTKETSGKAKFGVRYVEDGHPYEIRDEIETLEKMLAASENEGKKPIDGIKGNVQKYFKIYKIYEHQLT